jgi:hypothetical protein
MEVTQNIDKTINCICNWIQQQMEADKSVCEKETIEMTNALAALISARADIS